VGAKSMGYLFYIQKNGEFVWTKSIDGPFLSRPQVDDTIILPHLSIGQMIQLLIEIKGRKSLFMRKFCEDLLHNDDDICDDLFGAMKEVL
jgi:hypothetical protein